MTLRPDGDPELERQRVEVADVFREGWVPPDAGKPRVLTVWVYAEALRVINRGGPAGLDQATIEAVRGGARPGDPRPPLQPEAYVDHVTNAEVIITGSGEQRRVAVLFSHKHFPGVRFGHRFRLDPSGGSSAALVLREDIDTGALRRMMDTQLSADSAGITWTPWGARIPGLE